MLLHICTPCTKWSQSQSTSCSRHSRKFTVEAKTWGGPLTVNSQWNNLLDLKKVPKFWHLGSGSGSGSATLVDPLQPHWSQWPGRLISGWQDRTFLVNWHLDICSVAATAFFGHQDQLMGTSYVQSIWYQITLPSEGPKHSIWGRRSKSEDLPIKMQNIALLQIFLRWEVGGAQRQFSCSWLGAMSLFNFSSLFNPRSPPASARLIELCNIFSPTHNWSVKTYCTEYHFQETLIEWKTCRQNRGFYSDPVCRAK